MLFACIFVPDFPVAAVIRAEPDLWQQPVAVLDGTPPVVTVIGLNAKARAAGLELGMTRLQAEACPRVALRHRSQAQEDSAQAALLDCAHAVSPRVESTLPGTVTLDLMGLEQLFGPPASIAPTLAHGVAEMGMEPHIAVANNPEAAMHAARGFRGITVLDPEQTAARLGLLPIDVLSPEPEILETLERWGIRKLRALAALPPTAVTARLGQEGLRLQKLARGERSRTLVPVPERFHFSETYQLEDAVDLLEPLAFILNHLVEQICCRLAARSLATNELRLDLELEDHPDVQIDSPNPAAPMQSHHRTLRLPVPMRDVKTFLNLLRLDLKSHPPSAPVKKITLTAEPVRPRVAQNGFFVPLTPQPEKLELTLARIRSIVADASEDFSRVGSPLLLDSHRPDAFRMQRFTPPAHCASAASPVNTFTALRSFRPPALLHMELENGLPIRCDWNGKIFEVVARAGPWRGSGEWWTQHPWSREEWDLALRMREDVALYRIYKDVLSGQWFAEGMYD